MTLDRNACKPNAHIRNACLPAAVLAAGVMASGFADARPLQTELPRFFLPSSSCVDAHIASQHELGADRF